MLGPSGLFFFHVRNHFMLDVKKKPLPRLILQKSLFRRGEMAVLLLSGSWPGLRIGPKTVAKKSHDAYLGPVPGDTTPILGAPKKNHAYFLMTFFRSCMELILAKNC